MTPPINLGSAFKPNGVITLTTDFGTRDPFVGLMKAVVLARFPQAKLIDFTHDSPAYLPATAGFWLSRSWSYCAPGTTHLAVVDPGVGTARGMVLLEAAGQVFVAPDNGLLDELARRVEHPVWRRIELPRLSGVLPPRPSATFHGRDIFAPLVAEIAAGRLSPAAVGPVLATPGRAGAHPAPALTQIEGQIVAVDHFGNLITSLDAAEVRRLVDPHIHFRDQVFDLKATYGTVRDGELLALVNAFEVVEIAQACGHAQRYFDARQGERVLAVGR